MRCISIKLAVLPKRLNHVAGEKKQAGGHNKLPKKNIKATPCCSNNDGTTEHMYSSSRVLQNVTAAVAPTRRLPMWGRPLGSP